MPKKGLTKAPSPTVQPFSHPPPPPHCSHTTDEKTSPRYPGNDLHLTVGVATVQVAPRLYVTSGSHELPFIAYSDPEHQRAQRDLHCRGNRRPKSGLAEDTALDPFDVATMLAMAQMQAEAIPGAAFYKVFAIGLAICSSNAD